MIIMIKMKMEYKIFSTIYNFLIIKLINLNNIIKLINLLIL